MNGPIMIFRHPEVEERSFPFGLVVGMEGTLGNKRVECG